jgi:hypothetical protein
MRDVNPTALSVGTPDNDEQLPELPVLMNSSVLYGHLPVFSALSSSEEPPPFSAHPSISSNSNGGTGSRSDIDLDRCCSVDSSGSALSPLGPDLDFPWAASESHAPASSVPDLPRLALTFR